MTVIKDYSHKVILAGVGTDLYKYLNKSKEETKNYYFVDPGIKAPNDGKTCSMRFEDFVFYQMRFNPIFFNDSTVKSDRMIEHIPVRTLFTSTLNIMANLCKFCNTKLELCYPDIESVTKWMKKNVNYACITDANMLQETLFSHELCNIEAMAYGDHKTLLTEKIIHDYFKMRGLQVSSENVTIDNKPFYKKTTVTNAKGELFCTSRIWDEEKCREFVPQSDFLSDEVWKFSNKILSENPTDMRLKYYKECTFFFIYGAADKIKNGSTIFNKAKYRDTYTDEYVNTCFTREGHFYHQPCSYETMFNVIHPFCKMYAFRKTFDV